MLILSNILKALAFESVALWPFSSQAAPNPNDDTVIISPKRWLSLPPTPGLPWNPWHAKGQYAHVNGVDVRTLSLPELSLFATNASFLSL